MSATRTILLGTALGLAAGAVTFAQGSETTLPIQAEPAARAVETVDLSLPDLPLPGIGRPADAATETPLPQGRALVGVADDLIGTRVYDSTDKWVGKLSGFLPAPEAPNPDVVIDIGGFLGFGETPVAIAADLIAVAWTDAGEVAHATVALTEAELERMAQTQS